MEVQVLSAAPKKVVDILILGRYNIRVALKDAPVAQLDRAFDYGSKG